MLVTRGNLNQIFVGFQGAFQKGFDGAQTAYGQVAMTVPSTNKEETYGWLGQFPKMREWIGDRVVNSLTAYSYNITNRKFESTISIDRDAIEDDRYGVFSPIIQEMGKSSAEHPDELIFSLLANGFNQKCYDGQFFFDTDHPVSPGGGAPATSVSNIQAGAGPAWYLLDCSRAVKPVIYQERVPYKLTQLDNDGDENVFWRDEYVYGVRARSNAGFGLWQLAFASKVELTADSYEAARAAMMELKGDEGRPLGIKPDTLVVPPSLEGASMRLLNNGTRIVTVDNGAGGTVPVSVQNEWANTAKPIVTAWAA